MKRRGRPPMKRLSRQASTVGRKVSTGIAGLAPALERRAREYSDGASSQRTSKTPLTMEQVREEDKRRKLLLHRNNFDSGPAQVLCRWQGTIVSSAVKHPFFFLPLLAWLLPIVIEARSPATYKKLPIVAMNQISLAGTFVAFFVVFYANQCYSRWCASVRPALPPPAGRTPRYRPTASATHLPSIIAIRPPSLLASDLGSTSRV